MSSQPSITEDRPSGTGPVLLFVNSATCPSRLTRHPRKMDLPDLPFFDTAFTFMSAKPDIH